MKQNIKLFDSDNEGENLTILVGNKFSEPNEIKTIYSSAWYNGDTDEIEFLCGKKIYDFLVEYFTSKN